MIARLLRLGLCLLGPMFGLPVAGHAQEAPRIDLETSIDEALAAREEAQVDILLEGELRKIPAVAERVGDLKRQLDEKRISNSICVARNRGQIGKTAFTCNEYDYDVLFLARAAGQSAVENIAYISDFSGAPSYSAPENGDPLYAGLARAMAAIEGATINYEDRDCLRLVFRDGKSGNVRRDIPIIVLVHPTALMGEGIDDPDLRACLS
ncbi:MAG TPA: hypothetical protein VG742_05950 [Dongiaceae bacterium]|nr:hypothetical protein [Dongiaceae bacterium]